MLQYMLCLSKPESKFRVTISLHSVPHPSKLDTPANCRPKARRRAAAEGPALAMGKNTFQGGELGCPCKSC